MATKLKRNKHGTALRRVNLEMSYALYQVVAHEAKRLGWSWAQAARDLMAEGIAVRNNATREA